LLVVGVLAVLVAIFAVQAVRAYVALRDARADVSSLRSELAQGDFPAAERHTHALATHAHKARAASDGILWDVAARIPVLGKNVHVVQVTSEALEHVSGRPLTDGVTLVQQLQSGAFQPKDGQFDLDAFSQAQPLVENIAEEMTAANDRVDGLDADGLLPPVGRALGQVQRELSSITAAARSSRTAVLLLPKMLGADGPRNTLLVVQNNAEIRATGGMPGSFALLKAQDGRVTLGFQKSTTELKPLSSPALPLTAEEKSIYGPTLATDVRDANLTPDFPRAAQLLSAIVAKEKGVQFDGVISVDPVALSGILKATGPITVGDTTLTAGNAVQKLLNEPYQRFDSPDRQDAYFKAAAKGITAALLAGPKHPQLLVGQLSRGAADRHILIWSSHSSEQKLLGSTVVAGRLPSTGGSAPQVGFYLNDATAGKIEYYLDTTGSIYSYGCKHGAQDVTAQLDLNSSVRTDDKLSKWVTGTGRYTARGNIAVNLRIYAPAGGHLTGLTVAGKRTEVVEAHHMGREVSFLPLVIRPGEHVAVLASFRAGKGQVGHPVLSVTPGITLKAPQVTAVGSC
jgi:hypothetical protein